MSGRERERERETERERKRERKREREIDIERQRDRQREGETDRQTESERVVNLTEVNRGPRFLYVRLDVLDLRAVSSPTIVTQLNWWGWDTLTSRLASVLLKIKKLSRSLLCSLGYNSENSL